MSAMTVPRPSSTKAIHAKCHDCMSYYVDGRRDCKVPTCPLYYWMPYREQEPDTTWLKYSTKSVGRRLLGQDPDEDIALDVQDASGDAIGDPESSG